jgi:hypothetical protein
MRFQQAAPALAASLLPLAAAKPDCKPPVESEKLQELITEEG